MLRKLAKLSLCNAQHLYKRASLRPIAAKSTPRGREGDTRACLQVHFGKTLGRAAKALGICETVRLGPGPPPPAVHVPVCPVEALECAHPASPATQTLKHACRRVGITAWPRGRGGKNGCRADHGSKHDEAPDLSLRKGWRRGTMASPSNWGNDRVGTQPSGTSLHLQKCIPQILSKCI